MTTPKNFIALEEWSSQGLRELLVLCARLKSELKQGVRRSPLAGRNIGLIFEKASLRTRVSFEVGINQLGGAAIVLGDMAGRLGEREPIADFARVASRYVDGLVVRTYGEDIIKELARHATVPVINGLTDGSHPCQAMGDVFTLLERWGSLEGRTLSYIGDSNNVCHSLLQAAVKLGLKMRVASPRGYEFPEALQKWGRDQGFEFFDRPEPAAEGADALYTDVWTSMGQEKEKAQRLRDFQGFQVNGDLMRRASKEVLLMHCLPAHRGEEISDEAIESRHSIVFDQAENRLHIQKAVLEKLMAKGLS